MKTRPWSRAAAASLDHAPVTLQGSRFAVDRRRKRLPISSTRVRSRQRIAEGRHHAAVADAHLVAVALLDAKADWNPLSVRRVERPVDAEKPSPKRRVEAFGNVWRIQ
jgi:hypothetical protein